MYSHFSCYLDKTGIVAYLDWPHSRWLLRYLLSEIRQAGLTSLRIIVWDRSDASPQTWESCRQRAARFQNRPARFWPGMQPMFE